MKKPRRIEYEFAGFKDDETYHYWELYAKALEEYISHEEQLRLCGVLKPLKDKEVLSFDDWILLQKDYEISSATYYRNDGSVWTRDRMWEKYIKEENITL